MPDILIRGVEIPKYCGRCSNPYCKLWQELDDLTMGRHPSCPIKELRPHGDLIDVSKITLEYGGLAKISPHDFVGTAEYFAKQIKSQPVVIPASEEAE